MQNQPGFPPGSFAPLIVPPNAAVAHAAATASMIPAPPGIPPFAPLMTFNPFNPSGVPLPPPLLSNPVVPQAQPIPLPQPTSNNWIEYKAPDGRPYYYNAILKQTSWEKPDELKTESERLLDSCPWKECKTEEGKIFYYNSVTKSSSWTIPKELEEIKQRINNNDNQNELSSNSKNETSTPQNANDENSKNESIAQFDSDSNDNSNSMPENLDSESRTPPKDTMPANLPQQPSKSDLLEMFKDILRMKNISSNASWENTLKIIGNDSRFDRFRSHPERKQFFNVYKIQRAKEEKEEFKSKIRRAKEALATFLRRTDRMNSFIRYRNACEMFRDHEHWKIVPEPERREIFEDAINELARKEREEEKQLRKRNMGVLNDILESMTEITFRTTWQEAQQLLLENSSFAEDNQLLTMDKDDALIVFEKHIRQLELEEEEDKARMKRIHLRQQRLNRESFITFLDELHASGKLNSLSKWCVLYPDISADLRFEAMLSQPLSGSTPLDLFKFYVEDLKARYEDEKLVIRDILNSQHFTMTPDMEFSEFVTILSKDPRSATLDSGNVKLVHEKLLEKERERYRERRREEIKKRKRLESQFLDLLSRLSPPLNEHSSWNEIRPLICNREEFHLIPSEEDRKTIFDDAINSILESCSHHHNHKFGHRHRCRANDKRKEKEMKLKKLKKKSSKHRHRSPSNSSFLSAEDIHSVNSIDGSRSASSVSSMSLKSVESESISRNYIDDNIRHGSHTSHQAHSSSSRQLHQSSHSRRLSPSVSRSPSPSTSYHHSHSHHHYHHSGREQLSSLQHERYHSQSKSPKYSQPGSSPPRSKRSKYAVKTAFEYFIFNKINFFYS